MQEAKVLFSVTRQIKNPLENQGVIGLALREGWEASPPRQGSVPFHIARLAFRCVEPPDDPLWGFEPSGNRIKKGQLC